MTLTRKHRNQEFAWKRYCSNSRDPRCKNPAVPPEYDRQVCAELRRRGEYLVCTQCGLRPVTGLTINCPHPRPCRVCMERKYYVENVQPTKRWRQKRKRS